MKLFGKSKEKEAEKLEAKRHSLAHLLAAAVMELYPDTKRAIGPAIDNGFYFDFEFAETIGDNDLKKIEKKMRELLPKWGGFERVDYDLTAAKDKYPDNPYKHELIDEFSKDGEKLSFYKSLASSDKHEVSYEDLCKGGHVKDMKEIKADSFKLSHTAGAYWRGDEKNQMLTRIYGLAFDKKEELDEYLHNQEEAKKRDHRKFGKDLDLFMFSELVGPGLPLFTPKGTLVRDLMTERLLRIRRKYGWQKVLIPHLAKKDLYVKSGHWDKFADDLFHVKGASDTEFVMKPMNCPHHNQLYARKLRSYKELPVRYTEPTMVYRDEQAGELLGLARVRAITQDDGHIYARIDQLKQEVKNSLNAIKEFYNDAGLLSEDNYYLSLSVRDTEHPEKYLGEEENWQKAESFLAEAAEEEKFKYERFPGEATFYGPKLDFMFIDALGRERQLATVQVDFVQPERFELEYIDKDGSAKRPVMVHLAIAGSLERFMVILLEHHNGELPLWLSPVQARVLPITDTQMRFGEEVMAKLNDAGFRVEIDSAAESLGKKIRQTKLEKIPYTIVIGEKEQKAGKIKVESRKDGDLGVIAIDELIKRFTEETA